MIVSTCALVLTLLLSCARTVSGSDVTMKSSETEELEFGPSFQRQGLTSGLADERGLTFGLADGSNEKAQAIPQSHGAAAKAAGADFDAVARPLWERHLATLSPPP